MQIDGDGLTKRFREIDKSDVRITHPEVSREGPFALRRLRRALKCPYGRRRLVDDKALV